MDKRYILSIDQSTQGTKALLLDREGTLVCRADLPHRQIVNEKGWVSHDPEEIYRNTIQAVKHVVEKAGIERDRIVGLGISNQRETSVAWDRLTGKPIAPAIVWQCSRAQEICDEVEAKGKAEWIRERTGIRLSPYYPAAKFAWLLRNVDGAEKLQKEGRLLFGTMDTWLIYKLTGGRVYKTDYSNASRTQLFHIGTLRWDEEICRLFGLDVGALPKVFDSNAFYGETDLDGFLKKPIPICGVCGDSHGALFGQGCLNKGDVKATYGTGSSIMMNVGDKPIFSGHGIVTSLAWGLDGEVNYVLEGNIHYTGAVIRWLIQDIGLIGSAGETDELAKRANHADTTYLVPAFSGLGAPYWDSNARAAIIGISRTTRKEELVKAALESIAYQITDILEAMEQDTGMEIPYLRVDGGPTRNPYLMQFQSDMAELPVQVSEVEELSGLGAGLMAGFALGIYDKTVFTKRKPTQFFPKMDGKLREQKYTGWKEAVAKVCREVF